MRLTIFGATGKIGRHLVEQALAEGHEVVVFVRNPAKLGPIRERVALVEGDIRDAERVHRAIQGVDAILSALGPTRNTREEAGMLVTAMRNILAAMERHGVRRLVTISGAAVEVPGDQKGLAGQLMGAIVRRFARYVAEAKQREFEEIRRRKVDGVAVRPPFVSDGPLTGVYRVSLVRPPSRRIARADIAHFLLRQLRNDTCVRQAPFIVY